MVKYNNMQKNKWQTNQRNQYPYSILHAFNIANLTELRGLYARAPCIIYKC